MDGEVDWKLVRAIRSELDVFVPLYSPPLPSARVTSGPLLGLRNSDCQDHGSGLKEGVETVKFARVGKFE